MSKLLAMRYSQNPRVESNGCSCEACGRLFEKSISLTNLSTIPMEIYDACPFCFSRQNIDRGPEKSAIVDNSNGIETLPLNNLKSENTEIQRNCPHQFGYLKVRPRNTPIPEDCLTCKKMIQCLI